VQALSGVEADPMSIWNGADEHRARIPVKGGGSMTVNVFELLAMSLENGQTLWFRKRKRPGDKELTDWKRGTLRGVWWYDGCIARIYEDDPDDLIEHSLFLDMGDQIATAEPPEMVKRHQASNKHPSSVGKR
jgi:hypothetical protein